MFILGVSKYVIFILKCSSLMYLGDIVQLVEYLPTVKEAQG